MEVAENKDKASKLKFDFDSFVQESIAEPLGQKL